MNGDASTQYNFEPYFNNKKPRLEPNYSFDLCRLACSLFDYFIDDHRETEKLCEDDEIIRLIVDWITDDKGRNVLYKSTGEERYPDFKLYKMIARSVHNHIPKNQISNPLFDEFKITQAKYAKLSKLANKRGPATTGTKGLIFINIDDLPSYIE
jgi:hypothetical protein